MTDVSSEGHKHGDSIQRSINFSEKPLAKSARMKNRTGLELGEVFYISIIFHIPVS